MSLAFSGNGPGKFLTPADAMLQNGLLMMIGIQLLRGEKCRKLEDNCRKLDPCCHHGLPALYLY